MKTGLIIAFLLITSCTMMDDDYQQIEPKLLPYLNSFIELARQRGHEIDVSTLKLTFENIDTDGLTSHKTKSIFIDSTSFAWKSNPEWVVFHEFGHLLLHREHDNRMKNGHAVSMMHAHAFEVYAVGLGTSNGDKREYYIDELFTE